MEQGKQSYEKQRAFESALTPTLRCARVLQAAGAVGGSTWTRRPVFAPHVWLGAGEARGSGGARAGGAGETAIDSKKGRGQQVRRRRARRADVSGGPDVTWASGSGGHQQAQGCIPGGGGSSDDEGSSGEYLSSNNSDVEDDSDFELVSEDGGGKDEGPQCAPGGARQKQAQPQRSVAEAEAEEAVAPDGRTDCRQGWGRGSSGAWQQRRSIGAFGLSAVAEPPAASAAVPSTGCSGAASSSGAARPASGAVAVAPAAGPSATTASCATGVLVLGESRPRYTSTTQKQLQEQPCQHAPNRSQDEPSSLGRTSRKGAAGPHREPLSPGTAVQAASASLLPSGRSLAATSVTAAARDTVPASAGVATTRAAVSTAAPWAEPSRPEQRHIHGSGGPAHAPLLPPAPAMGSRAAPAAAAPAAHAARAFTSGCSQGQGRPAYEPAEQCPVGAHDAGALREAAAPPTHPSGPGGEEQSAGWDHVAPGSRQWEEGVDNGLEEAGWQDDGGDDAEGEAGGDGGHDLDEELWGDGYGGGEADPEDHLDEHWGGFGHQEHHPNEQSKTAVAVAAGGGGGGGGKAAGASKRKAKQSCLPFQQQKQPAARQRLRQHQQVEGGGAAGEEQEAWAGADGGGLPEGALDTFLQQVGGLHWSQLPPRMLGHAVLDAQVHWHVCTLLCATHGLGPVPPKAKYCLRPHATCRCRRTRTSKHSVLARRGSPTCAQDSYHSVAAHAAGAAREGEAEAAVTVAARPAAVPGAARKAAGSRGAAAGAAVAVTQAAAGAARAGGRAR